MLGLGMYLGKLQGPNRPKAPFSATGGQAATSHVGVRWFCDKGSKQKTAARRTVRSQQSRMRQKPPGTYPEQFPCLVVQRMLSAQSETVISLDLGNFHRFCEYQYKCPIFGRV
jgi:hypothetical protein